MLSKSITVATLMLYTCIQPILIVRIHAHTVADPGFYKGGFYKNECVRSAREICEATPTLAPTTPIFDLTWRVLCSLSRLRAASRPEFAQNTRR